MSKTDSKLTRRNFVEGAAMGAAAMGLAAAASALADEPGGEKTIAQLQREGIEDTVATDDFEDERFAYDWQPETIEAVAPADAASVAWDIETEVLCCGYGATGACAAIRAADAGARVLIIEKSDLPGGSMARCGGGLAGAGTRAQKAMGIEDDPEGLFEWLKISVGKTCPEDILKAYAYGAGENIDWVDDLNMKWNDHEAFVPQYTEGYFNGLSNTGTDYVAFGIDPNETPARSHWIWIGEENEEGITYAGPELFDPLYQEINSRPDEIEAMFNTRMESLIQDVDGTILGVVATDADGNKLNIKAKKGVVLGCGGYPYGYDMQFCYSPKILNYRSFMHPGCTGDGIRAAQKAGAALINMTDFQPLENAYAFVVGTTKDEVLYPMIYKQKWDGVFAMWDRPLDENGDPVPGQINLYGATFAETHGGVVINADGQVMDVFNQPIPRLYASGCDTGTNPYGAPGHYPGCGTYVGFAMVYGTICGRNVATLPNWDE